MKAEVIPFPRRWPRKEILALIREISLKTNNIKWSEHAGERMAEREIGTRQVLDVMRNGRLRKEPALDEFGDWRIAVGKRSAAGQVVEVALALCEGEHGKTLTVITVM